MKKILKLIIILFCVTITGNVIFAAAMTKKVIYSDITAYINGLPIPSYNLDDRTVVIAEDLEKYGFDLHYVDKERCLYIDYNPNKEVTATPEKENKNVGSVAFIAQATDIYTRVNEFNVTYDTSYSINGQILVSVDNLEHCHSSYITWNWEKRSISFDYVPYWEICPSIDYEKQKTENISHFIIECMKTEQKELNENEKEPPKFYTTGTNEQYLSLFRMTWREKTNIRDFPKSWFENGKITIDFSIREEDAVKAEQLTQLLNAILTINSEGNVVAENLNAVNEHIKVFINGESIPITTMELKPDFSYYTYYIELDKEIKSVEEIQTIKIECK